MNFRPLARGKRAWWDTELARQYGFSGLATRILARRLFNPLFVQPFANDRDQFPW